MQQRFPLPLPCIRLIVDCGWMTRRDEPALPCLVRTGTAQIIIMNALGIVRPLLNGGAERGRTGPGGAGRAGRGTQLCLLIYILVRGPMRT